MKHGSFIARPINKQEDERNKLETADKILVNMFPQFFDEELKAVEVDYSYINEKLGILLDELLVQYVSDYKHVQIMRYSYGLDCEKLTMKEIAERYNTTPNYINQIKRRSLEKLRNEEVEKIN